ncbi:MAG: Lrp/AsnC family transcriptional regulator [Candidatus Altiarchaeota archaeon]|nr:Lrp/AsnC family transcriptional regulator [Candidatus Altiarchaeota archaeon]
MDVDEEILKILEDDARIPVKEMAEMLDLSEKEVEDRMDKLSKEGIIRKFKTSIDWKRKGKHRSAAVIQVKVVPQQRAGFSRICREISKDSRVKDLYVATGEYDLILLVETANIDEISEFVTEKLAPKKEVVGTYTHIVLQAYKRDGVISFDDKTKRLKISI